MPHLEIGTFLGQGFWLLISFSVLYFLVSNFLLPNVASVIDARAKHIDSDIKQAENLKNESVIATQQYESLHAKATAEARKTLDEALKKTEANIDIKRKELQAEIDKSLSAAEKKIAEIEQESSSVVRKVSSDITNALIEKVAA